jgi:hypothetical protein
VSKEYLFSEENVTTTFDFTETVGDAPHLLTSTLLFVTAQKLAQCTANW